MGFLLDSSGSITSGGWNLIRTGLSNALPLFLASPDQYEPSVVSFSTGTSTIINKQIITGANIGTLQSAITGAPFLNQNTNYQSAFNAIAGVMSASTSRAAKSYINLATDGDPNEPGSNANARAVGAAAAAAAVAGGIDNISIEGIGGSVGVAYLTTQICYPLACDTTQPFSTFPANGFYLAVSDAAGYEAAVRTKIATITGVPEPATMVLLGSGLAGLGVLARRRRSK